VAVIPRRPAVTLAAAACLAGLATTELSGAFSSAATGLPPRGSPSVALGCASSVFGALAPDWHSAARGAVGAGPLTWPYLRVAVSRTRQLAAVHGLAPSLKALLTVRNGATVRVAIPPRERSRLSLDYTDIPPRRPRDGRFRVGDGASSATFRACPRGAGYHDPTEFAGGFIVDGARCAVVDIYATPTARPVRRSIPFAVPPSSCPPTSRG
jgi:hypothetical protein